MPRREYEGRAIRGPEDLVLIKSSDDGPKVDNPAEREFARLLLDKTSLEITYEPTFFYYHDDDGVLRGTLPDFRVVDPTTGVQTYIEITTSSNGKGGQQSIMQRLAPDVHYVVFKREKLESIQQKFPDYHFFNGNGNEK
jgi:hypothetical protein